MVRDVVVRAEQFGLHEFDVAFDETLLAERRRGDRQFHTARLAVELDFVIPVADGGLRLGGNLESGDDGGRINRDVEDHFMPCAVAGNGRCHGIDELRSHRKAFGAGLRHGDGCPALHLDVQVERRGARVFE